MATYQPLAALTAVVRRERGAILRELFTAEELLEYIDVVVNEQISHTWLVQFQVERRKLLRDIESILERHRPPDPFHRSDDLL